VIADTPASRATSLRVMPPVPGRAARPGLAEGEAEPGILKCYR
jgi:hypothetical protein